MSSSRKTINKTNDKNKNKKQTKRITSYKFSMFQNVFIGNVTINIYEGSDALV